MMGSENEGSWPLLPEQAESPNPVATAPASEVKPSLSTGMQPLDNHGPLHIT